MEESESVKTPEIGKLNESLPYLAWAAALAGLVGSLFLSEVMQFPPCTLCWYQRVAMYPLVVIIGAGIVMRDPRMKTYALSLIVCGLAVAIYHNLLYYGFIPETLTPCSEGVSCSSRQLELFGFVTIPLMSLGSFVFLGLMMFLYKPKEL
ncbi:MAG: disulfide bond formation protein B [Acidobacteria bacterium]|nr:disulfide bond formation protein B [Acidobacteriota bacterium]